MVFLTAHWLNLALKGKGKIWESTFPWQGLAKCTQGAAADSSRKAQISWRQRQTRISIFYNADGLLKFAPAQSGTRKITCSNVWWQTQDENKLLTKLSRDSAVITTQLPLITAVLSYYCIFYCSTRSRWDEMLKKKAPRVQVTIILKIIIFALFL